MTHPTGITYLVNLGYVGLALRLGYDVADARGSIEALSQKVGAVLLVLGGMHFFNLFVFARMRRRARLAGAPPPVALDAQCGLCRRARSWLASRPPYVELEFLPAGSPAARQRFARLDVARTLRATRGLALTLRGPARMALAQRMVACLADNRSTLWEILRWKAAQAPTGA